MTEVVQDPFLDIKKQVSGWNKQKLLESNVEDDMGDLLVEIFEFTRLAEQLSQDHPKKKDVMDICSLFQLQVSGKGETTSSKDEVDVPDELPTLQQLGLMIYNLGIS